MKEAIADRLSAFFLGILLGLLLSTIFAVYGAYHCLLPGKLDDAGVIVERVCGFAESFYWELLLAPGFIGLVFGFDRMMAYVDPKLKLLNSDAMGMVHYKIRTKTSRSNKKAHKKIFRVWGGSFFLRSRITVTPVFIKISSKPYVWSAIDSVHIYESRYQGQILDHCADIVFKNKKRITVVSSGIETIYPKPDGQFLTALDEPVFELKERGIPVVHDDTMLGC